MAVLKSFFIFYSHIPNIVFVMDTMYLLEFVFSLFGKFTLLFIKHTR